MDNLVSETNKRLQKIIDDLKLIKDEYESKLDNTNKEIESEMQKVKTYKENFFASKEKIEKMNSDIAGFEQDYQNLVEKFKDDELANILVAANKEVTLKIEERKRKIVQDKAEMNELVNKAEKVKQRLVKLTAEKKALEVCLNNIIDSFEYYKKELTNIIEYSNNNQSNLCNTEKIIDEPSINMDDVNEFIEENSKDEEMINLDEVSDEEEIKDEEVKEEEKTEDVKENKLDDELEDDDTLYE